MKSCTHAGPRARTARYWLAAAALAAAGGAQAISFQLFDGNVEGSFDTTLGYGVQLRTEKFDPDLSIAHPGNLSPADGVTPASPQLSRDALISRNNQYGNRTVFNDKWDVFSNIVKASHELQLNGSGWSAFLRGNYFYDFAILDKKEHFPQAAENRALKHGDITDAYVLTRFGGADQFTVRLGKQVISWGESTFIAGSLNDINTVDISKLRQPGAELKDALVGTPAVYGSWQMTEAFTIEAFKLFAYDEVKLDPYGTFFSTLDFIADGAGFPTGVDGLGRQICSAPDSTGPTLGTCHFNIPGFGLNGVPLTRAGDNIPSGGGQYGVALRYYAPNLGNGFDFGLYYQKLHDHNPQLSAIAGTAPAGGPPPVPLVGPGRYFVDYAKDVERYGFSFNTTVGPWALGGEYSYRRNAPIQGVEFGFVGAYGTNLTAFPGVQAIPAEEKYEGFERYKRHQIQLTTQRLWGPMPMLLGADQWNTIGEVGFGWVDDVPGADVNGHESSQVTVPGYVAISSANDGFIRFDDITGHFWGFQARSTLTYNNILFNRINMDFNTAFRWDVEGVSPEVGANVFVGGRKQLSLGVNFDYALRWRVGINQTFIFDGEDDQFRPALRSRPVSNTDRDFLSLDVSYTF